ncbi:hypothetical protein ACQP1V_03825 [Microtetraspora malaysiensis]|uniref:hypothetical protein n=1 Tax=Microtetraspora malaysiensis TaxID=161358 RepID=UPI003D91A6CB
MPDMSSRRGSRSRAQRSYETARWQDEGPLVLGSSKEFIRRAAEKATSRQGVLKHVSGNRQRFYAEAVHMNQMNGTPGILPVWDIDDAEPGKPTWYAMPRAQLLQDGLGDDATLRDVVSHVAFLAGVLADLAEQGTYHRDIKPGNLFWWNDGPVLADFGIAAWNAGVPRTRLAHPVGLTRPGQKLGPANFIAPEMRNGSPADRGERADVYSLAKTLFVLALPQRGPYPPDGTHRADAEEFSLWETGGSGKSLPALRHILEAATEFAVRQRLSMADFRDELHAWLSRYSRMEFRRRGDRFRFRFGWEGLHGISERHRRDHEETRSMMVSCMGQIAEALAGHYEAWTEGWDRDADEVTLGDYGWEPNGEDGFVPENGTIWMATATSGGRRIVLEAVLDHDVCFIAESQVGGPPWRLERQWGPTPWGRPRLQRTADRVEQLAEDVVSWLAEAAANSQ